MYYIAKVCIIILNILLILHPFKTIYKHFVITIQTSRIKLKLRLVSYYISRKGYMAMSAIDFILQNLSITMCEAKRKLVFLYVAISCSILIFMYEL